MNSIADCGSDLTHCGRKKEVADRMVIHRLSNAGSPTLPIRQHKMTPPAFFTILQRLRSRKDQ
jgi:hypothetical protein